MKVLGLTVAAGVLCALGCDSPPARVELPSAPVRGKVLYRGKPVEGVVVEFHPLFEARGYAPSGTTGADGAFTVTSDAAGAPVGEYAVTFTHPQRTDPGDAGSEVDRWKGKYSDAKKSKFKATVKDGPNELEPFKLD